MRDKLGDHRAKYKQCGDRLRDRDHARDSDRYDVSITDGSCGYEAEINRARKSLEVGANRGACLDQPVPAFDRTEPIGDAAQQDHSDPDEKQLQGGPSLDQTEDGVVES